MVSLLLRRVLFIGPSLIPKCMAFHNPFTNKSGQKHLLFQGDLKFIVTLLNHRHIMYLNEIQDQLFSKHDFSVSIVTLVNTLCCLHYFCKKVISAYALKRDNLL